MISKALFRRNRSPRCDHSPSAQEDSRQDYEYHATMPSVMCHKLLHKHKRSSPCGCNFRAHGQYWRRRIRETSSLDFILLNKPSMPHALPLVVGRMAEATKLRWLTILSDSRTPRERHSPQEREAPWIPTPCPSKTSRCAQRPVANAPAQAPRSAARQHT